MEACAMTYREQDPSAAQARIGELERENKELRNGRAKVFASVAGTMAVCVLVGAIFSASIVGLRSCVQESSACDVACAAQNGTCSESSSDGFACVRHPYTNRIEYYAVPRRTR
jgi:hypothetical protein